MSLRERFASLLPEGLSLALIVSLLAHLLLIFGSEIDARPRLDLKRIDASLYRPAPDSKTGEAAKSEVKPRPPVPKKKPRQVPKPAEAKVDTPAPPIDEKPKDLPQLEPEQLKEEQKEIPPPTPQPLQAVGSFWPKAGQITFSLAMGEQRFQMGKVTHEWVVDADKRYEIRAITEPTGVALIPWFRPDTQTWISSGRITGHGLQPESFVETKSVGGTTGKVELDWVGRTVALGTHKLPLVDGTQDVLSLLYQLGYPGAVNAGSLSVTNGRMLQQYQFEVLGVEQLVLPFGATWRAQHIRARFGQNEVIEVWTAPDYFGLPVQMRVVDRKGVVYYMLATDVRVARDAVDKPAQ